MFVRGSGSSSDIRFCAAASAGKASWTPHRRCSITSRSPSSGSIGARSRKPSAGRASRRSWVMTVPVASSSIRRPSCALRSYVPASASIGRCGRFITPFSTGGQAFWYCRRFLLSTRPTRAARTSSSRGRARIATTSSGCARSIRTLPSSTGKTCFPASGRLRPWLWRTIERPCSSRAAHQALMKSGCRPHSRAL